MVDSSFEKKIDDKLGKEVGKEIKKEVDKEIEKRVKTEVEDKVNKELDKKVSIEVKKKLKERLQQLQDEKLFKTSHKFYKNTEKSTRGFRIEFRKHSIGAITAAFAFLIALSWRTPIENLVNLLIYNLGLTGKYIYIEFISAIIITIIAVIILMLASRWNVNETNGKK